MQRKLVSIAKLTALAVFVSVVGALIAYLSLQDKGRRNGGDRPKLQGQVVAVFNNTRYQHEVEGRVRFILTAGTDRTYQDGTHELEQVRLEAYRSDNETFDVVSADRAKISDTTDLTKLDAEFTSNVMVRTSEGLALKTGYLRYAQADDAVETEEIVEFEYKNMSGRARGMIVKAADERVHLLREVEVVIKPDSKDGGAGKESDAAGTRIRSGSAVLDKKARQVILADAALITRGAVEMKGARVVAYLSGGNSLQRIEARGSAYLAEGGNAEVTSNDMDFLFAEDNRLVRATATGEVYARSLGEPLREAWAGSLEIDFADSPSGTVAQAIRASGNSLVKLHPTASASSSVNPTERQLKASRIALQFFPDGRNLKSAEAVDDVVLTVSPLRPERGADRKTIRAPYMTASFFEDGNRIRSFSANGGVRAEMEATIPEVHPLRVSTSKTLEARFAADSQDLEQVEQQGEVRYNEGDRYGTADRSVYDARAEALSLRGGRPTGWDSKARIQADEIDYDREKDETHARGDVRTTYYSREAVGDAAPFRESKSPIFVTADRADARNGEGVAVYTGSARAWQDDNFVRGDKIELYEKEKRMVAVGNVKSALYKVERETSPDSKEVVPAFASAGAAFYSDADRLIRYEGDVKARQGGDRVEAQVVDVYLKKEVNEADRIFAQGNVVLVQPERRGYGDKLTYTSEDGRGVLIGRNARIDDNEKGAIIGGQLTFYSRDDKITVENQSGAGRVRSTHRLTKNKERK